MGKLHHGDKRTEMTLIKEEDLIAQLENHYNLTGTFQSRACC